MVHKKLETIANKEFSEFLVYLSSLKPSDLVRLELYLYRNGKSNRAANVLQAGLINCGDEYYSY